MLKNIFKSLTKQVTYTQPTQPTNRALTKPNSNFPTGFPSTPNYWAAIARIARKTGLTQYRILFLQMSIYVIVCIKCASWSVVSVRSAGDGPTGPWSWPFFQILF